MASRPVMRVQWKLHKLVWRASGGQLGTRVLGMPVLELITTGRKTGQPRPILISYLNVNGAPTLIGTHAGAEHDPAWVGNLRANPDATVVRRGRRQPLNPDFQDRRQLLISRLRLVFPSPIPLPTSTPLLDTTPWRARRQSHHWRRPPLGQLAREAAPVSVRQRP